LGEVRKHEYLYVKSVYNPIYKVQYMSKYFFVYPTSTERRGYDVFRVGWCYFGVRPNISIRTERKKYSKWTSGGKTSEREVFGTEIYRIPVFRWK
jgi:hypothetical protein